jgi:TolB-like protein/DNA-binding winged helix-turn-helix (wHTH) protein/Tfp pilus assembly protein PilF
MSGPNQPACSMAEPSLTAYRGDAPFVFVSYSHADQELVRGELTRLTDAGFNVWFDRSLSPGSRWTDELAERISEASLFLFFVSPNSVASENCRNELQFALGRGSDVLAVHLVPTELPMGIELELGARQAILKYEHPDEEYHRRLIGALASVVGRSRDPIFPRSSRYRFGPFELDPSERVLLRDGEPIQLQPKTLDLLTYLVQNSGRLLDKQTLLDDVWKGTVVTENSLTRGIRQIRIALGDDADHARYVETVQRTGYRFIAPVEEVMPPSERSHRRAATPGRVKSVPRAVAFLLAGVIAVAIGAAVLVQMMREPAEPAVSQQSIAVLPFANLSSDPEQEYLSDGLSEELLNLLARIDDLRVIARTSSFYYKGKDVRIADVARELGVSHVLEGSVRSAGNRIRITAQLIDTRDSSHVWSETYERNLGDIFALEDEIAARVVEALEVELLGESITTARVAVDVDSYQEYLQGRFFWNRRAPGDDERAEAHYLRALELDPSNAAAWAGLSGVYNAWFWQRRDEAYRAKARDAAEHAVALDPTLPEAHARLATAHAAAGEMEAARSERRKALELGPNNPLVLSSRAFNLHWQGKTDEAIELFRRAAAVDPLSAVIWGNMAHMLMWEGRYAESQTAFDRALELNPLFDMNYGLGTLRLAQGKPEAALELMTRVPEGSERALGLVMAFFDLNRKGESAAMLTELVDRYGDEFPFRVAEAYAWRGERGEAFQWVETAIEKHGLADVADQLSGSMPFMRLRDDPRWQQLKATIDEAFQLQ